MRICLVSIIPTLMLNLKTEIIFEYVFLTNKYNFELILFAIFLCCYSLRYIGVALVLVRQKLNLRRSGGKPGKSAFDRQTRK